MIDDVTKNPKASIPDPEVLAELTPKTVVLDMLAIAGDISLSSPVLTGGGEIMGFKPVAVRVAVSRLAAEHLIESPRRGEWRLAPDTPWAREQARWQHLEALMRPWNGDWWVALTHRSPRSDRSGWRHQERALWQRGFREVERDLFLRPANLSSSFQDLRRELIDLGLHPDCPLLQASSLSLTPDPALWHSARRQAVLHEVLREMRELMARRGKADRQRCERFLRVGRAATRALNTDPLLPEEWTGPSARAEVAALLPRFIALGRGHWFRYLGIADDNPGYHTDSIV